MAFTATTESNIKKTTVTGSSQLLAQLAVLDAGATWPDGGQGEADSVKVEFIRNGAVVYSYTQSQFGDQVRITINDEEPAP